MQDKLIGLVWCRFLFDMTDNEDVLHARLQKSFDAVKQLCVEWFASTAEASALLDCWSSLFEEYSCASLVDVETTSLGVHSDIDFLTRSKTRKHLSRMLDELQIHQCVFMPSYGCPRPLSRRRLQNR